MHEDSIEGFARLAEAKAARLRRAPAGFLLSAMLAGVYIGFATILVHTLGVPLPPEVRPLVMGASFAVGLILVSFAGAELFTGQAMYMVIGLLEGRTGWAALAEVWAATWIGNLAGSVLVAALFALGGGGPVLWAGSDFLYEVAAHKTHAPALALVARGILCNWLVCAGLWMSARTQNDAAKCIVIFLSVYAFVASGFDHSVANMTVMSLALIGEQAEAVTLAGAAHNLLWVTIGNAVGGGLCMGAAYWFIARCTDAAKPGAIAVPARSAPRGPAAS